MWWRSSVLVTVMIAGCGPSAHELKERTLSTLNTEADRWDGGEEFATSATDAYGRGLKTTIEKGTLRYTLEIRSTGPDGLPKNSDDIVVFRSDWDKGSSITKEVTKAAEEVAAGTTKGTIKGFKQSLGLGGRDDEDR